LGVVVVLSASLVACGDGEKAQVSIVTNIRPLTNDFDARIASKDGSLWLVKTSKDNDSDGFTTSVAEYDGSQWKIERRHFRSSNDWPLSIAIPQRTREPCIGYSNRTGKSEVACRSEGVWRTITPTKDLSEFEVHDLGVSGDDLIALYTRVGLKSTVVRVAKQVGRTLRSISEPINLRDNVLANLGQSHNGTSRGIDVAMENLKTGDRWVATYRDGEWSHTGVLRGAAGPQLSGTVRTRQGLILPVTAVKTGEDAWKLNVFTYDGTWHHLHGTPLNVGPGSAQGRVDTVGDSSWFTWTQVDTTTMDRRGRTIISAFAAHLLDGGKVEEPIALWSGRAVWPGHTQAVPYRGGVAFLYMRGSRRGLDLASEVRIEGGS